MTCCARGCFEFDGRDLLSISHMSFSTEHMFARLGLIGALVGVLVVVVWRKNQSISNLVDFSAREEVLRRSSERPVLFRDGSNQLAEPLDSSLVKVLKIAPLNGLYEFWGLEEALSEAWSAKLSNSLKRHKTEIWNGTGNLRALFENSNRGMYANYRLLRRESDLKLFSGPFRDQVVRSAWLSNRYVKTRAHYDKSHNLLHQVEGTKEIFVWHSESISLPSLHPHFRQLAAGSKMPNSAERIILQPGETLWLPAYTWHQVQCQSRFCFSISAHVPSEAEHALSMAMSAAHEVTRAKNAIPSLLHFPVAQLCRLYRMRWESLLPSGISWKCLMEGNSEAVKIRLARLKLGYQGSLEEVARIVSDVHNEWIELVLWADIIEALALEELESIQCVGSYLRSACLESDYGDE